ncbi:hypothetical protein BGX34_003008 [Mortierella sp. NVP85]|nr:hypothetical protein BGX34_003008 [Mortierella sp. NVP85]
MSRTALLPLLFVAILALLSQAQAQTLPTNSTIPAKPECAPLAVLYKEWVTPCTSKKLPANDADPAWKPCICLNGFFPLATATEQCEKKGTGQVPQITATSLDNLCAGYKGYVAADKQTANATLAPALTSATALGQAAQPTPTAPAGIGKGDAHAGAVSNTASFIASLVAVVLATAVAL